MPVRTGRVSSREAELATLRIVSTNALGRHADGAVRRPARGSGGKSSPRSVRMWNVALPATSSTSCSAARSSSVTVGPDSERDDVDAAAGPGSTTEPSRSTSAGERDAQADLHVGGAQLDAAGAGEDLDAGQRLDRAARRGDAADGLELGEQLVARGGQLHDENLVLRERSLS